MKNHYFFKKIATLCAIVFFTSPIFTIHAQNIRFTTTIVGEFSFYLKTQQPNTSIQVDWGDGSMQNYIAGDEDYTEIQGDTKGLNEATVKVYGSGIDWLMVSESNLTSLDVSQCLSLTHLDCNTNQLQALDISKNTALNVLSCKNNQLQKIDVSKNTALTYLHCSFNQLTALDVLKNKNLEYLYCGSNQLPNLDVSQNTALEYLRCFDNLLTELDVTKNTALMELSCYSNQLQNLNVLKNINLLELICFGNQLQSLDVSKNINLTGLFCWNNLLDSLDVSKNEALIGLNCSDNKIRTLNTTQNVDLNSLFCSNNSLTTLDVSKNTNLWLLDCSGNQLSDLDLSKNTVLDELYCGNNLLQSLDVSKNINLIFFNCNANLLSNLDLSHNTCLGSLACEDNQLTELDISQNKVLGSASTKGNRLPLTELYAISQQIEDVDSKWLGTQHPVFFADTSLLPNSNLDFSSQATIGGISTTFLVKKDSVNAILNSDYSIADGIITFIQNGSYYVEMTNTAITSYNGEEGDYSAKAITGAITITHDIGIEEIRSTQEPIKVYPNPVTNGKLKIENGELGQKVEIYDMQGTLVGFYPNALIASLSGRLEGLIDISGLANGIYIIRIGKKQTKVIVQK